MTTRLTDRPLLVVAALTPPVGTAKHACNMLPLPSNRSFTDNKNAVAPTTRPYDLFIIIGSACRPAMLADKSTINLPTLGLSTHRPCPARRGFVQPGFKSVPRRPLGNACDSGPI